MPKNATAERTLRLEVNEKERHPIPERSATRARVPLRGTLSPAIVTMRVPAAPPARPAATTKLRSRAESPTRER